MSALGAAGRLGRRLAWPIAVAAVVLLLVWLRILSPVAVRVARVDRGPVVEEAFGRGTIESQREATVGFDLVGRVSDVLVDEGARVTLGQELARLETTQAEAELQVARTGVAAARASLQRLAADEERVRALVVGAEREARRTQSMLDSAAGTAQQRDDAADRLRLARADLDRVLAQRAEATRGIELAASGAQQRQVSVLRATLLAPFEGLVTRRLREPGDTVTIGSTVLRIVDTSRVYVRAAVDETVLPRLAEDQRSTIEFPGSAAPVAGRVTRVSLEADRQTHELVVEVTPDRLDRRVAIGQRADVRIELGRRPDALRVPVAMLHHDDAGPYVLTGRGGRISVVRPRLGAIGRDHVEVLGGLAAGDTLVTGTRPGVSPPAGRRWKAE